MIVNLFLFFFQVWFAAVVLIFTFAMILKTRRAK